MQSNSTLYPETVPRFFTSPFYALLKLFEKNQNIAEITFSAFPYNTLVHKANWPFGCWRRGQIPFSGESFVDNLGKVVLCDLLGLKQLLNDEHHPEYKSMLSSLSASLDSLMEEYLLGANSKVLLYDGSFAHIPMIDFSSKLEGGIYAVKSALKKIDEEEGYIFNSGRTENSFHYYGVNLLSQREWEIFSGKCLLLDTQNTSTVGSRYIGHRLIDGFSCLRISKNSKKPKYPVLVAYYKDDKIETGENPIADVENIERINNFFESEAALFNTLKGNGPLIEFYKSFVQGL